MEDMKKMLTFLVAVAALAAAAPSQAAIGWAGQIWPTHDYTVTDAGPVNVYMQVWKEGYTDLAGRGDSISAILYYGPDGGPYSSVEMVYNTDIGNNDEYTGAIPQEALSGNTEIWFYCEAYDSTDASTYSGATDQNGASPPFKLNITPVLSQDVLVYFRLCLPPEGDPGYDPDPLGVCVTGGAVELTSWGNGVQMNQPCPETSPQYYEIGVLFAAGGSPAIEWKYKKNDCQDWESAGNRSVTIDDTNATFIIPWVDHWDNYVGDDCPLCGIGVEQSSWGGIKQIHQ